MLVGGTVWPVIAAIGPMVGGRGWAANEKDEYGCSETEHGRGLAHMVDLVSVERHSLGPLGTVSAFTEEGL